MRGSPLIKVLTPEEVERRRSSLVSDNHTRQVWLEQVCASHEQLRANHDLLMSVIRYYADPRVWTSMGNGAYADLGSRARAVLDELK